VTLKYNYFQLSKTFPDPRGLSNYFLYLTGLNVPCCVAKSKTGWALWREGIEAKDHTNTNTVINNVEVSRVVCMVYDPDDTFGFREVT